jgi:hypothetical protein
MKGQDTRVSFSATGLEVIQHDPALDRLIVYEDWDRVRRVVEKVTLSTRPDAHAALVLHNEHVIAIKDGPLGWETACRYDVQQRQAVALDGRHDISTYDAPEALLLHHGVMSAAVAAMNPAKRPASSPPATGGQPAKRARTSPAAAASGGGPCFRCGRHGCRAASCTESTTVSGHACAAHDSSKNANSLRAPGGKVYCISYAVGKCTSSTCPRTHACSICRGDHGAGSCSAVTSA